MSSGDSGIFSDDDDDLLLELSTRPPKLTQNPSATQAPNKGSLLPDADSSDDLTKAQGEASILRDKLHFLNEERKRDKERQAKDEEKLKVSHNEEIARLKLELQNAEDEKKFLLMEVRRTSASHRPRTTGQPSYADPSSPNNETTVTENVQAADEGIVDQSGKRRRIGDDASQRKQIAARYVPSTDDSGQLFDTIMFHRINGVKLRTIEILSCLKLPLNKEFRFGKFDISEGESIGKQLTEFLFQCKKTMILDKFVKTLVDALSSLIQDIMISNASRLAVPFLLVMMYQTIVFRPSAVQQVVLKHTLEFVCALIMTSQKPLKRPLHETDSDDLKPQIFQYEMVDLLVTVYSYDILEASVNVLQSNPSTVQRDILNPPMLKSIEQVYKLALPISYRPIMSVVFNTVAVINMIAGMVDLSTSRPVQADSQWWKDCITRLYHMLGENIDTFNPFNEESSGAFSFSRLHDVYGMVRNVGSNSIGRLIPRLIFEDRLQDLPRVILKDDIEATTNYLDNRDPAVNLERWVLLLKSDVLHILENMITMYPQETAVANGAMLVQLTRFMSTEQELMLHRVVGQSSPNVSIRCHLIEHSMALIYRLWMDQPRQMTIRHVKEIESELVMSLWRFLAASERASDLRDVLDNQALVDEFGALTVENRRKYFDDAFDNAPEYIEQEILDQIDDQTSRIMQVRYDPVYQQMARTILESKLDNVISMEGMDSLYVAMGK